MGAAKGGWEMNSEVRQVYKAARDYCACNQGGGNLHIVLEDGNISDVHIFGCQEECLGAGDSDGIEVTCLLLDLSEHQRGRIVDKLHAEFPYGNQ